ncbi:MAG: metal-dependent hydrolase [Natronomonas sp.]
MYKTGHYGAALLVYAPVGFLLLSVDPGVAIVGCLGSVGLSRLPDYDLRVPFLEHRGITLTLLFLIVVTAALGGAGFLVGQRVGADPVLAAGLGTVVGVVGVGSHLLADALTPAGVPLLWPLSDTDYSLSLARASNPIANYGLLVLGVAATAAVGYVAGTL